MSIDRRAFLARTGSVAALTLAASGCTSAVLRPAGPDPETAAARSVLKPDGLLEAAPELQAQFQQLLRWMHATGWLQLVQRCTGLRIHPDDPRLEALLLQELGPIDRVAGLEDFGGCRLIQPGDPAMSLLYHVLASPHVLLGGDAAQAGASDVYPDMAQIDLLENYIYARAKLAGEDFDRDLVLGVFAYEYRPARMTPHRDHADLVFARTGVARTGTEEANYNARRRSFLSETREASARGAAVTPARFALFLAERVAVTSVRRKTNSWGDGERHFLLPLRKLSAHDPYLPTSGIEFLESHRNEKLRRLALHEDVRRTMPRGFDIERPPFLRESRSSTRAFTAGMQPGDGSLVRIAAVGASALLTPVPGPLVREAIQDGQRLRFLVPPTKEAFGVEDLSNRRYTTLKLLDDAWARLREGIDFLFSDVVPPFGSWRRTGLRSPRNAPVFVNIRYRTDERGEIVEHLDRSNPEFERVIARGNYWAAMFEDGLCDGCIDVRLAGTLRKTDDASLEAARRRLSSLKVLPAFSVVAAPDLMPYVEPGDFYNRTEFFLEGGPNTADGGRIRANPHIRRPGSGERAFPSVPGDLVERRVADTITAVVCLHPEKKTGSGSATRLQTNTLPDNASNVFAPGWELTFARDHDAPLPYFATFGLGSPFPEDMKLCAAANGMWPGSSPDAARTYFGDLEPVRIGAFSERRPPTAVPLTDEEIGLHPDSPAVREHGRQARAGWDGEHGPYLEIGMDRAFSVNFADMRGSDYVQHALRGEFDFSILRGLSAAELVGRMDAMRRAIRVLPGGGEPQHTKLWLVSAERVADWVAGAQGVGIPPGLAGGALHAVTRAQPGIAGPGMLFLFVVPQGESSPAAPANGRRRIQCSTAYICQATVSATAWARFAPFRPTALAWSVA